MKVKLLILLLILLIVDVIMIQSATAFEFDNVKSYDSENREYTITNAFNIPLIRKELARIKLETEPIHSVIDRGEGIMQLVGEFTISSKDDYVGVFDNMQFYDLKRDNRNFDRYFEYRKRITNKVSVDDFERVCDSRIVENGTEDYNCRNEKIGSHIEDKYTYEKFTRSDLRKENITLGIFLDVRQEEHGDWIPTIMGERLIEFSEWSEGLNVGLFNYYKFDNLSSDGTEAIESVRGFYNISGFQSSNWTTTSILGLAYRTDGSGKNDDGSATLVITGKV